MRSSTLSAAASHRRVQVPPRGYQPVLGEAQEQASLPARFWQYAVRGDADECWLWLGATSGEGYGLFRVERRHVSAARIAWSLGNSRPFPSDRFACHTCDNPSCVNPAHIWPGTHSDNMQDMMAKGRNAGRSLPREFCRQGHRYTEKRYGQNFCRICKQENERRRSERRKQARGAGQEAHNA